MECEHIYDEEKGDPDSGIAPGTRWEDIPDNWECPICGAPKSFFKLLVYPMYLLPSFKLSNTYT